MSASDSSVEERCQDPEQIALMAKDVCLLVNSDDKVIGTATKEEAHRKALLHRAFSVLLFDSDNGNLLLQHRSKYKVTFPLLWANTCCSHPLNSELENIDDAVLGVKRAAIRKLEHELGIDPKQLDINNFICVSRFSYFARDSPYSENEIDYVLVYVGHVDVNINLNEVCCVKYVSQSELKSMLANEPESLTPWFKIIMQKFLFSWWDSLYSLIKSHPSPYKSSEVLSVLKPFIRSDIPSLSL